MKDYVVDHNDLINKLLFVKQWEKYEKVTKE